LNLTYDELLSTFAFNFDRRRYTAVGALLLPLLMFVVHIMTGGEGL
jgi:hypothetical protein